MNIKKILSSQVRCESFAQIREISREELVCYLYRGLDSWVNIIRLEFPAGTSVVRMLFLCHAFGSGCINNYLPSLPNHDGFLASPGQLIRVRV